MLTYSEQLFEAYIKGRKASLMFSELADDIAEKDTLTAKELKEVRLAFKILEAFMDKWNREVFGILDKIKLGSYKLRFADPRLTAYSDALCDRWHYSCIGYKICFFELFCMLDGKVGELEKIIENYDEIIKQNMPPEEVEEDHKVSVKIAKKKSEVIYKLEYDSMSGRLSLNGEEIYKCNLDSKLDKALISAFKTPYQTIRVDSNLASAISPIRVPEELKRLMFRTGKGCFRVDPEITAEKLEKNGLKHLENGEKTVEKAQKTAEK